MSVPQDHRRDVATVQFDAVALHGASRPSARPAPRPPRSLTILHSRSPTWCQAWASTTDETFEWNGSAQRWPVILDANGAPRQETIKAFLLWLSQNPKLPKEGIKFAQKWLMASMQMERMWRGLQVLDEGEANKWMEVRVAAQQTQQARGEAAIAACVDQSKRADHLPTWEEKVSMMQHALAGDARVHRNPLRVLQTGFEVLVTHATGVRGQLVRSAKFEHVWPHKYPALAGGAGIDNTVMYNTRGRQDARARRRVSQRVAARAQRTPVPVGDARPLPPLPLRAQRALPGRVRHHRREAPGLPV
jgi:hypothetical protein